MNIHARDVHADGVKAIAESLIEELRRGAAKAEEMRRVPDESIALLKSSGLLRVLQPASCGGRQLTMRAHVDAVATVARGCNATAWVLGVYHAHSWMMGHMDRRAQHDVYGRDPSTAIAAVIGPRGRAVRNADGACTLTGFWPFVSGNAGADWLLLGAEVFNEAGEKLDDGDFLVPIADVEVLDDWHVAGLQGTGSSSVRCKDVAIPSYRYLSLAALLDGRTPPYDDPGAPALYKSMAGPVLGLCIASSATGVARSALEEFVKAVPGRKISYTAHTSHHWPAVQTALGEAAAMINAAELIVYRVADDIDHHAERGERMTIEMRGRIRADIAYLVRLCRDAVDKLYTIGGAAGLSLKSPVQRAARNLQATNMHGLLLLEPATELYGRILLGLDPGTPTL